MVQRNLGLFWLTLFFLEFYAQHAEGILKNVDEISEWDLSKFAVNCGYSDLVAEDSILSVNDMALLELACCYVSRGAFLSERLYRWKPQFRSRQERVEGVIELCHATSGVVDAEVRRAGTEFLENWCHGCVPVAQ
jgi:hypothetical protein